MRAAAAVGLVLAVTTACGGNDCGTGTGANGIAVQVPPAVQRLVTTFRFELCQGARCGAVNAAAKPTGADGTISDGVVLTDDTYEVELSRLGKGWKSGPTSGLTVTGFAKSGRVVLERTEQFTFDVSRPDGQDCDPYLRHSTGISGEDLVG